MKRFFCTVCGRMRRVRKLPKNVEKQIREPQDRFGVCTSHKKDVPAPPR